MYNNKIFLTLLRYITVILKMQTDYSEHLPETFVLTHFKNK